MDCRFRFLTKDKKSFDKLKPFADGFSKKGLIIIDKKCSFFETLDLKKLNVEVLITPLNSLQNDCFYYDGEIKNCNKKILEKFNMENFEPIEWKKIEEKDIPF